MKEKAKRQKVKVRRDKIVNISLCLLLTIPFSLFPFSFAHAQQPAAPRQAPKLAFAERMKQYVQAVGGTIDQTKSAANMIVSNTADARGGKVTIVIVNDQRKNLVGFYIYNFGSLKGAANREAVYKYLLATNDEITLGGFFVDSEDDIGYKYLVNASQPMTQDEFNQVYLTMAAVARERRAKIRELLGPEKN